MGWRDALQLFRPRRVRSEILEYAELDHDLHDTGRGHEGIEKMPTIGRERGVDGLVTEFGDIGSIEYNPEFAWPEAFDLINMMIYSDATGASIMQCLKLPLLRTNWKVVPDTDKPDEIDKDIAAHCQHYLMDNVGIRFTWESLLNDWLTCIEYGHSVNEVVWEVDPEGLFLYPWKFGHRLAKTITQFYPGKDGNLKKVIQNATKNGRFQEIPIPGSQLLTFTHQKHGLNFRGISAMRPAHMHWFYKNDAYRIEAVRLDRWGVGIPVAEVKEGYPLKEEDKRRVIKTLKGLRSNARAYIFTPEEIKFRILVPEGVGSGGATGGMESILHHDVMMARSVLAHFMTTGQQKFGNYATVKTYEEMFIYVLQSVAKMLGQEVRRQVIAPMCHFNFDMTGRTFPKVVPAELKSVDIRELTTGLYRLVQAKIITPDDSFEAFVRNLFGWPNMEKPNPDRLLVPGSNESDDEIDGTKGNKPPGDGENQPNETLPETE